MERLTHTETPANHVYVDRELVQLCWYSEMEEGFRGPAIDRLAAYEDTGLTPDELAHAVELLKAEKEGRCVVLPCKVGDYVWIIYEGEIYETRVQGISMSASCQDTILHFGGYPIVTAWGCQIGKVVFLTLAEAEAALEKENRPN